MQGYYGIINSYSHTVAQQLFPCGNAKVLNMRHITVTLMSRHVTCMWHWQCTTHGMSGMRLHHIFVARGTTRLGTWLVGDWHWYASRSKSGAPEHIYTRALGWNSGIPTLLLLPWFPSSLPSSSPSHCPPTCPCSPPILDHALVPPVHTACPHSAQSHSGFHSD